MTLCLLYSQLAVIIIANSHMHVIIDKRNAIILRGNVEIVSNTLRWIL